jgi:hypothetical protein
MDRITRIARSARLEQRRTFRHLGDPGHPSRGAYPATGGADHRRVYAAFVGSGYREPRRGSGVGSRLPKTTVSRVLRELRDRYTAFCSKSLADVSVMALVHGRHLLVLSAAVYLAAVLVERAAA